MGVCRHDQMWKHKTQYPRNAGNTVHYSVLVVYSRDHMAGWLGAVAHGCCPASQENIVPLITSPGKDQASNFEDSFYWIHTAFTP